MSCNVEPLEAAAHEAHADAVERHHVQEQLYGKSKGPDVHPLMMLAVRRMHLQDMQLNLIN